MTETNTNETRPTTLTRRQRRAQRLADLVAAQRAIEAEEAAADRAAQEALKRAGLARSRAVEELYDLLGIDEETTTRTRKDGTSRTVRTDRDETRRAARLVEAVVAMVDRAGGMTEQPSRGLVEEPSAGIQMATEVASEDDEQEVDESYVDPHERGFEPSF